MKISSNWLKDFIEHDKSPQEIAELLTLCGLEVDAIENYTTLPKLSEGLLIGEVLTVMSHPNADKLRLTTVTIGAAENLSIVCGAPNVAVGQKVVVATIGTELQPKGGEAFTIKKSKIRGELSEGMLCAEDEIGLSSGHEGIMVLEENAVIGQKFKDYLKGYSDTILEIGLTPNRVDAASHRGVSRDLSALLGQPIKHVPHANIKRGNEPKLKIRIEDIEGCPRYSGLIIRNVKVGPSPEWIKERLLAIGLSSINNIVDCTNYVLHELGHPLHAFDLSTIKDDTIIIRKAGKGEKFITLDGKERKLNNEELLICNSQVPMALAGVFGGLESGVNNSTTSIFIESAYFSPSSIRKASRKHQLFTEAAFRFERGTDPNAVEEAALRAAHLILECAGGEIDPYFYDEYPVEIAPAKFFLRYEHLNSIAGIEIPKQETHRILERLGFKILEANEVHLHLQVPGAKVDVYRPIDVIEEVLRIYGIDKLPLDSKMAIFPQKDKNGKQENKLENIYSFLTSQNFFECFHLSLTPENEGIEILNGMGQELSTIRSSMLKGGLKTINYNLNRQAETVKIFEKGRAYTKNEDGKFTEKDILAIWICGNQQNSSWDIKERKVDFFYAKSIVQSIISFVSSEKYSEEENENDRFSYGLTFSTLKAKELGVVGLVKGKEIKSFDIEKEVFYIEIDLAILFEMAVAAKKSISLAPKFPMVERDLALLVAENIQYGQIKNLIEKEGGKLLKELSLFDVYKGAQIPEGMKSMAIRLKLQDNLATLEEARIEKFIKKLTFSLKNELQAELRA